MPVDRINTRGEHYEVGVQQGRLYYALVGRISMTKMLRGMNFVQAAPIVGQVGKGVFNFVFDQIITSGARKMEKNIEKILPNQYEKLTGIAEGFGLKTEKLAKALFFENFSGKMDLDTKVPRGRGCTAGIVTNRFNQGFLVKNFDFPIELEQYQIIRFCDLTTNEYSTVGMGEGPLPGIVSGINEKGLGITMNAAYSTDLDLANPPGTMFVQEVLETLKTTDEAVDYLMKAPMPVGWIFLILDKNNDGRIVERSATTGAVRAMEPVESGYITCASNNYMDPTMKAHQIPDDSEWTVEGLEGFKIIELSNWRLKRMRELMEDQAGRRLITASSLREAVSDHQRPPNEMDETVCRHSNNLFKTLSSVYINPRKMRISFQDGNPCSNSPLRKFKVQFNYRMPNIRYLRRDSDENFYDRLL
ncbi:MAG: hypothetical protein JW776_06325 [Candidatus Lokiarchaeota archaeon]|nr:hypothetical protein [Candidatus Lokiarchaeota archaeon]